MAIELVTGKAGQAHITADQLGAGYASIVGSGRYRGSTGSCLEATLVDANTVRIADGDAWFDGRHVTIPHGSFEELTIDSGSQDMSRIDLIVIRYAKNASTGIESASLEVVKGSPSTAAPERPSVNEGSILDGDILVDMPLCLVLVNGIVPDDPVMLPEIVESMHDRASVETILENQYWTIKRSGNTVMVQVHGYTGVPSATVPALRGILSEYKPSYNVSSVISTSSGASEVQVARLAVYADDGGVYLPHAGYTGSGPWYGTLTYVF